MPNGGLVYIPSGIYIINVIECVNLKNNITMFGDGNSSVLKLADNQILVKNYNFFVFIFIVSSRFLHTIILVYLKIKKLYY